jgi:hypothetical protein
MPARAAAESVRDAFRRAKLRGRNGVLLHCNEPEREKKAAENRTGVAGPAMQPAVAEPAPAGVSRTAALRSPQQRERESHEM